jgi:hypothetical protein
VENAPHERGDHAKIKPSVILRFPAPHPCSSRAKGLQPVLPCNSNGRAGIFIGCWDAAGRGFHSAAQGAHQGSSGYLIICKVPYGQHIGRNVSCSILPPAPARRMPRRTPPPCLFHPLAPSLIFFSSAVALSCIVPRNLLFRIPAYHFVLCCLSLPKQPVTLDYWYTFQLYEYRK